MLSKILGGALGVTVIAILFLWNQVGDLREELGTAKAGLAQAGKTNENNVAKIDDLLADKNKCEEERQVDRNDNLATVSALKKDLLAAESASSKVRVETREIFREPSCDEYGRIDINAVCPALAVSVRNTATDLDRGRPEEGEGGGPGEAP